MLSKVLSQARTWQSEIVLTIAVVLIAVIAFEGGKISALRQTQTPLQIKEVATVSKNTNSKPTDLRVVASKNSTLYHFLWCSGAQRIKEGNKIIFASEQEAQSQGHTLASNCQK